RRRRARISTAANVMSDTSTPPEPPNGNAEAFDAAPDEPPSDPPPYVPPTIPTRRPPPPQFYRQSRSSEAPPPPAATEEHDEPSPGDDPSVHTPLIARTTISGPLSTSDVDTLAGSASGVGTAHDATI